MYTLELGDVVRPFFFPLSQFCVLAFSYILRSYTFLFVFYQINNNYKLIMKCIVIFSISQIHF